MGRPKTAIVVESLSLARVKEERQRLRTASEKRRERRVAKSSQKAYDEDWEAFETWCARLTIEPSKVDRDVVGDYLEHLFADRARKITGIRRALSGVLFGLRRRHGIDWIHSGLFAIQFENMQRDRAEASGESRRQARPLSLADLQRMLCVISSDSLRDVRDRALLLVGWMGGMRRSELVGLKIANLEHVSEGILVRLSKAKTDQRGERSEIALPRTDDLSICPVMALEAWISRAQIAEGPVFRALTKHGTARAGALTGHAVSKIVKRIIEKVSGEPELNPELYSGHSLRRGIATYADAEGVPIDGIRQHLRHQDAKTTQAYIERSAIFTRSIVRKLFAPSTAQK